MRLPGALVLVPALLVAPALRVQEREPQLNLGREAPQASRWYGWQLIASDLAAISLIAAAAKIGDGPAPVVLGSLGVATLPVGKARRPRSDHRCLAGAGGVRRGARAGRAGVLPLPGMPRRRPRRAVHLLRLRADRDGRGHRAGAPARPAAHARRRLLPRAAARAGDRQPVPAGGAARG